MTRRDWFPGLRWAVLLAELGVGLLARFGFGADIPALPVAGILLVQGVSIVVGHRARVRPAWFVAGLMVADVVCLTVLLQLTGRALNPFAVFYLVYIALAVLVLRAAWTWLLVGLAVGGYATLFIALDPHAHHDMSLHLQGMWAGFALTAAFIAFFAGRVRATLRRQEAELAASQVAAAQAERLASLGTLAAGAAHELGTPLGTIAVVAREMEHALARGETADLLEDARLVRQEVDRCRAVLVRLADDAGVGAGDQRAWATVAALVEEAVAGHDRVVVALGVHGEDRRCTQARPLVQALRAVLDNALRATAGAVHLTAGPGTLTISDDGPGMTPDVLAQAQAPFFTTRAPGEGMGLGLYLATTTLRQLGGALRIESTPGAGTRVEVTLP
ncbi:MAG: ATP-binding protein [bacterium]